jgi:hypothetical protein
MPQVLQGQLNYGSSDVLSRDMGYSYPYELDLRPGSTIHTKLKEEILFRARESHDLISNRVSSWNEVERVITAYIDIDDKEKEVKNTDSRKPVSIVFPYSFVIMETILTYLVMAFLTDPIIKYEGVSPEDTVGTMLLEKIIRHQCYRSKMGLSLHTFLRDSLVYGMGASAPVWTKRMGMKPYKTLYGERDFRETVIYEGNKLNNIDPYLYLPDPSVPIQRIQDGEFVGWVEPTNRLDLMKRESSGGGAIFNVKYLKDLRLQGSSIFKDNRSDRNKKTGVGLYTLLDVTLHNSVDVIWMYIDLIPKDWQLGTSEQPEKWLFALANDEVIIQAKKLELTHGMFPIVTAAPDFDGYSVLPLARTEILYGMQEVLNFLFNSHIANVRKSINDMLVVDPYQVNIADLKDPNPGKLIRLRRPAWGKGVKDVIQQLNVNDITRANIQDSSFILEWMNKIGGADESLMGALRQGGPERLTKGEFQGTRSSAISRVERLARIISMQSMQDLGYMMAEHTQQLMSEETYVDITGRWQEELTQIFGNGSKAKVSPFDLMVNYDVMVSDGSLPNGSMESWSQIYKILAENPGLGQQFDMVRIFEYIATLGGAKNVSDFKIKPKILPDNEVMDQANKGNIIPMPGIGGMNG